jgi:hypothetical protein
VQRFIRDMPCIGVLDGGIGHAVARFGHDHR